MSKGCPELIFVAGLQMGQRVRLTRATSVLGRGGGCDILLSEEYVSRRHVRYELLQIGPTLENLSSRGTWINGKRFKAGKKVHLETGDLIGVGAETQMLFVAAGDDPMAAVTEYRRRLEGGKDAFGRKVEDRPPPPPPPASPLPADQEAPPEPEFVVEEEESIRPSDMTAGEREQVEAQAKRRKLMIGLGIYVGCIVMAGIVIGMFVNVGGPQGFPEQPILSDDRIREELSEYLKRTPNPVQKDKKLREARGLYHQYALDSRHLSATVHAFKEAMAYSGKTFFDSTDDEKIYKECLDKFTSVVQGRYRRACILEKNKDWALAEAQFRDLLATVGERHKVLFNNIQRHYGRAKYYHEMSKPKKNPMWGGS